MDTENDVFEEENPADTEPCPSFAHSDTHNHHQFSGETDCQLIERVREGDNKALERLQGLVRRIAASFARRVPACVSYDDLVQEGWLGLLDATKRYVAQEGVSFEMYATQRIRGAMLDMLRRSDTVSRSVRKFIREAEKVRNRLSHNLLREPTIREWKDALPENVQEMFWEILSQQGLHVVSDSGDDTPDIPWKGGMSVEDELIAREKNDPIKGFSLSTQRALAMLNGLQREVLYWRYQVPDDEVVSQTALAERFGVSKSRICQIETKALRTLREHLRTRRTEFAKPIWA